MSEYPSALLTWDQSPGTFAVCGGGTGGHIFPALAVADALRVLVPNSTLIYFGRVKGMEQEWVADKQIEFVGLDISGFSRRFTWRNLASFWKAIRGFRQAQQLLKAKNVRAILGTGGYVSGPVILAAIFLGIPSIIHESNALPGLTNRLLATGASRVAVTQSESRAYFPRDKVVVTGFPLRLGLSQPSREEGCRLFGLDPQRPVIFIFPGSLAAQRINQAVAEMLPLVVQKMPEVQFLWMTGEADFTLAQQISTKLPLQICVRRFIREVPEALAAADLVLARAGAGTVAEISATGKPALLVPYPYATGNHQWHNAAILQRAGCAEILEDKRLNGKILLVRLKRILKRLKAMTECAAVWQANYPKNAAEKLARLMLHLAENKPRARRLSSSAGRSTTAAS